MTRAGPAALIPQHLVVRPLPHLPQIKLYTAHPASGLSRLCKSPPYWAHVWAGGAALARYVMQNPRAVRDLRVLDFGAGSGVAGIAAALSGAAGVVAIEPDPWGQAAVTLNAALNGVSVQVVADAGAVDVVLCGDVFYDQGVAEKVLPVLAQYRHFGARVLVGDPGRRDLPLARLTPIKDFLVRDFGDGPDVTTLAWVYEFDAAP